MHSSLVDIGNQENHENKDIPHTTRKEINHTMNSNQQSNLCTIQSPQSVDWDSRKQQEPQLG